MDTESIVSGGAMERRAMGAWAHIPVVAPMGRNPQHGVKE